MSVCWPQTPKKQAFRGSGSASFLRYAPERTAPPILATSPPFAKRLEIVKAWLRQTSFSRPRIIAENAVVSKDYIVCASRLEILKAWSRRIFDSYDHE